MVSIVIPYYNRESYLPNTLQTVAATDFRPLTVILVNNHSTDGSEKVCRDFADTNNSDDFHVIMVDEPAGGAAKARNKGLEICKTPFVYFFDSDDEFDTHFLSEIHPWLNEDVDMLAVTTNVSVNGQQPKCRPFKPVNSPSAQVALNNLATQCMVFRTDFLRSIGGWNEKLMMWNDWELAVRALNRLPRMRWLTLRPYHVINVHSDSLTGDGFSQRIMPIRQAMRATLDELNGRFTDSMYLRMENITGRLLREKNLKEAEENKKLTFEWFSGRSAFIRMCGRFIRWYVSIGGKGAPHLQYYITRRRD